MSSTHPDGTVTTAWPLRDPVAATVIPRQVARGVPSADGHPGHATDDRTDGAVVEGVDDGPDDLTARTRASEKRAEAAERRVEAVERALATRAGIDQAKGAIMAVFALDADAAFDVLVWVSQHANVKLASVADRFLERLGSVDLGQEPREVLTAVLGELGGCRTTG